MAAAVGVRGPFHVRQDEVFQSQPAHRPGGARMGRWCEAPSPPRRCHLAAAVPLGCSGHPVGVTPGGGSRLGTSEAGEARVKARLARPRCGFGLDSLNLLKWRRPGGTTAAAAHRRPRSTRSACTLRCAASAAIRCDRVVRRPATRRTTRPRHARPVRRRRGWGHKTRPHARRGPCSSAARPRLPLSRPLRRVSPAPQSSRLIDGRQTLAPQTFAVVELEQHVRCLQRRGSDAVPGRWTLGAERTIRRAPTSRRRGCRLR